MKKTVIYVIILCLVMGMTSGCGKNTKDNEVLQIVCTTFPIYDWVNNIVGENSNTEVKLLLDNGVDMHSFQPGAQEIALVSGCDLLIYVGGESDAWIEDAIKESVNKNQKTLSLMDILGDKAKVEDEILIPSEDEEEHSEGDAHVHEIEYDEHVWLSLTNAQLFVKSIADVISDIDRNTGNIYQSNAEKYCEKLAELDENVRFNIDNAKNKAIIVADRFPFRYLVDDYDIDYYAAFPGCSAETEASFEIVVYLAGKIDSTGSRYVVVTESADRKIAETVIDNTTDKNQEIIILNSMQSVTTDDYKDGRTYYGIMEENLNNLIKILQ